MQKRWAGRVALFLGGQTVTLFGSMLVQFAISWYITLTTQNGGMMTISILCGFLPQLIVSPLAGVWADRYSRKALIIMADGIIATSTAVLAVVYALGYRELWPLFVISAVRSVGAGVQTPAVGAFLPDITPQEQLVRVNGINATIQGVMMLVAPAAAGALYATAGIAPIFWIDVATAAVGILLLAALKTARRESPAQQQPHVLMDMAAGARYMWRTPWLRQLMAFYMVLSLMFGPVVFLTPLMVTRSFGDEPWRLMAHEMVFAAGSILGGFTLSLWGGLRNKTRMLILACAAFGATTFAMGFSPNFWVYLAIMLPMGITLPFFNTSSISILQARTEPQMMGRVFGLVSVIGAAAMPLSMLIFGPLADHMAVELQLIITGAVMVVIALCMFRFKAVMEAGEPVEEAGGEAPPASEEA